VEVLTGTDRRESLRGITRLERLHHFEAMGWRARLELGAGARCPFPRGHLRRAWFTGFLEGSRYLRNRRRLYQAQLRRTLEELRQGQLEDLRRRLEELRRPSR